MTQMDESTSGSYDSGALSTSPQPSRRRRRSLLIGGGVLATLLVAAGALAGVAGWFYADKALPGTSVAGVDVGGLTRSEIIDSVTARAEGASVTVSVGGSSMKASLSDLGVSIDAPATADAALAPNASVVSRITGAAAGLVGMQNRAVEVVSTQDTAEFDAFAKKAASSAGPAAQEPEVAVRADKTGFEVSAGAPGVAVDTKTLSGAVTDAVGDLSSRSVDLEVTTVNPSLSEADVQAVADAANALVSPDVTITDGIDDYTAAITDKVAWVKLPLTGTDHPVLDDKAVRAWVDATAKATDEAPDPAIDNVDSSGNVVVRAWDGKPGMSVNNQQQVASGILAALQAGEAYAGDFDYDEVPQPVKTMPVIAGAENLVYSPHEGEKWVDINLSNHTVTAYEGGNVVLGPVYMVDGQPGWETVTGTYHVYHQTALQDMGCTPEWPYCTRDVPWSTFFTGSFAMHGAPWRSSFGYAGSAGSHGCVNMTVGDAQWIYNWATIGTPVVSHY